MVSQTEYKKTHKENAIACFNAVWELLEKKERTVLEDDKMINLAHASFYHWTNVEDHTPTNISVGYWQLSRVYSVLEIGERALCYASKCLDVSIDNNLEPFYVAYAHEAKARAYSVLNNQELSLSEKEKCVEVKELVENEEYKLLIANDLLTIR
jgi:proteasome assembly chaperone (PAC2) family protein